MDATSIPSRDGFDHTPCYCEENVYRLCARLRAHLPAQDFARLYAVFVSNPERAV
ncbi:hypothetical protein HK405_010492, partial [Cladochytrium tenue]